MKTRFSTLSSLPRISPSVRRSKIRLFLVRTVVALCPVLPVGLMNAPAYAQTITLTGNQTFTVSNNSPVFYPNLTTRDSSTLNVVGGGVGTINSFDTSAVNISSGTVGDANSYGTSVVNISGGTVGNPSTAKGVIGFDDTTVNISGGTVSDVASRGSSTVNISAGAMIRIRSIGAGTFNISGGSVVHGDAYDNSVHNITGGNFVRSHALDSSVINILGGNIEEAAAFGISTINMSGGTVDFAYIDENSIFNINGGNIDYSNVRKNSIFNMTGGSITNLEGHESSVLNIAGGSITDITGYDNSILNITGGTIGQNTIRLISNSILNLFGTGLSFSPTGTGSDVNGSYIAFTLSGILQGGQSINGVTFRDYNGGASVGDPNAGTGNVRFFAAAAAPEPGTLALLGLGLLGGRTLRRRIACRGGAVRCSGR